MKFKITSSFFSNNFEKIIKEYPCLKDFGFEVVEYEVPLKTWTWDENGMRILQIYGKETIRKPYVTIESLEQLLALKSAIEEPLIITEDEIEIYDGYRE